LRCSWVRYAQAQEVLPVLADTILVAVAGFERQLGARDKRVNGPLTQSFASVALH
jgi:hypothetical protein